MWAWCRCRPRSRPTRWSKIASARLHAADRLRRRHGRALGRRQARHGGGAWFASKADTRATGEESTPLDEAAVATRGRGARVPASRRSRWRRIFRCAIPPTNCARGSSSARCRAKPVTCAHELSSKLDAPRRALTAALNARLTPQIRHLIEALSRVLAEESIDAPLMIVKGDGSLMRAEVALEYPVETILSGPAASVVGAGFLTGLERFRGLRHGRHDHRCRGGGGRPAGDPRRGRAGRRLAHDGRGGGRAHQRSRRRQRGVTSTGTCACASGPRKAMPLSLLAQTFPAARSRSCARSPRARSAAGTRHAIRPSQPGARGARASVGARSAGSGTRWHLEPRHVSTMVRSAPGSRPCGASPTRASRPSRRSRRAMPCTCSAARAAGAARPPNAARAFSRSRSATRGPLPRPPRPQEICERTHEHVVRETGAGAARRRARQRPGIEARRRGWGVLGERLMRGYRAPAGRFSGLMQARLGSATAAGRRSARRWAPTIRRSRGGSGAQLVDPGACGGLQRGGRGRGRGVADRRDSGQSADVQGVSSARSRRAAAIIRTPSPRSSMRSAHRAHSRSRRRAAPARPIRTSTPR